MTCKEMHRRNPKKLTMKNIPLLLIAFLIICVAVSAFSLNGESPEDKAVSAASTELFDQLTDDMQYLVELSDALGARVREKQVLELAVEIAGTSQQQNRELCRLAISREMPIRQELSKDHRKRLMSLMMLKGKALTAQADQLLAEHYQSIQAQVQQYRNTIDDPEILSFLDELLKTNQVLRNKIDLLESANT